MVTLEKHNKSVNTLALIDSGSDSCIFPASLAAALGIRIPNQKVDAFSGSSDSSQLAYFEDVTIHIWEFSRERKIAFSFDSYIGFCPTFEHSGLGLLGQDGFFNRFKVSMSHRGGSFEIE